MLTITKHLNLMKHALGKTPDSRHLLIDTFNRAGRALFGLHNWSWKQGTATVVGVDGQDFIDLPSDFSGLLSAYVDNSSGTVSGFSSVESTTIQRIAELRQTMYGVTDVGVFYMAFVGSFSGSAGDSTPTPRAMVWPTPGDEVPTITLIYDKRWRECDEADLIGLPNIDPDWEGLLVLMARYHALITENPEVHASAGFFGLAQEIEQEKNRLIDLDGTRQVDHGQIMGAVSAMGTNDPGIVVSSAVL